VRRERKKQHRKEAASVARATAEALAADHEEERCLRELEDAAYASLRMPRRRI
jgi:hypothetical protein